MNRVDRLMGILTFLQSHKYVTAEKLSDKFEISVRTVYRDVKALGEIGIPVSFENNRGYFIVEGYFLPPVSLTATEANALILVAALANRFGDKAIVKNTDNAIQKIRAVLRHAEKEKSEEFGSRIKVLNTQPTGNNYLSDVQQSITDKIILHINYTDGREQKTSREVEPIGMIFYTEQWHMIAWCWKRNDYRDFRMNHIDALTSTSKPFRKKNHISLDEHILSWK